MRKYLEDLRSRGLRYWAIALMLIIAGTLVGIDLDEHNFALQYRYRVFHLLQAFLHREGETHAKRVSLVLIGDDDYWKGELARRVPIKRDYLAKLLRKLDQAEPEAIALDFNLRSPVLDGTMREHRDYLAETQTLIGAIQEVSLHRPVILPATFHVTTKGYVIDQAVYDGANLTHSGDVRIGHILSSLDKRRVLLSEQMADGSRLDSFAEAIARALDESAARWYDKRAKFAVSTSLPTHDFPTVWASEVMRLDNASLKKKLRLRAVIVGAGWHRDAFGQGPVVDLQLTPAGFIGGAFVHANWTEAILDSRVYWQMRGAFAFLVEFLLSVAVAVMFALRIAPWRKALGILIMCVAAIVFGYVLLQNFGLFFDFYIPVVLIVAHAGAAKVIEMRDRIEALTRQLELSQ
jgi:CHASE2 domain-containing sensor protein